MTDLPEIEPDIPDLNIVPDDDETPEDEAYREGLSEGHGIGYERCLEILKEELESLVTLNILTYRQALAVQQSVWRKT